MDKRVVISGLGVLSSIGNGVKEFAASLKSGASGVASITMIDTAGFESDKGCELGRFDGREWLRRLDPASVGRSSQFSIAAARMAIEDAGIDAGALAKSRCGVSVGTTEGESQLIDRLTETWVRQGPEAMAAEQLCQVPASQLSLSVAREFGLQGEALTISTACAAGNYAIGYAYDLIRTGESDFMLCGGADCMSRKSFSGFYRLGAVAPDVCRPFDTHRKGILTGEGSGMLLLESLESALARGAHIYAEVLGYGLTCDANHPVSPDQRAIAACIRLAHKNAGIEARQVDYISAHGTGTKANDLTESAAIKEVFGESPPPVSSIKSMLGHTMGAASALSSIACALALEEGFLPPTINHRETDPACGIDCVPNQARKANLKIVQNNAFAFYGNNAILVFGKFEG